MSKQATQQILIKGGMLIDGNGGPVVPNPGVYIEGDKIIAMGEGSAAITADAWRAATVIDATGQWVMPGMIDGHCHLSLHQGGVPGVRYPASAEFSTLWAARSAQQALHAGQTGVSVPGGKWYADVAVREAIAGGMLEGPRVFCAGRGLTPLGGIFDTSPGWRDTPDDSAGIVCKTIEDYVTHTREQCTYGVDMIKIADSYWGDTQAIALDELKAVVGEAHRRNVKVSIHSRGAGSTRDSALAGVDWIFHADWAKEAEMEVVAQAGIPIMPVLVATKVAIETAAEMGFSSDAKSRLEAQLDANYKSMQLAKRLGIQILVGSDSGNAAAFEQGRHHARELELLVKEVGLTPMEAIMSATKHNAKVIGLDGKVGVLAEGMLADILLYDADPLKDIAVLGSKQHLKCVMKGGTVIDRSKMSYPEMPKEPTRAPKL